RNGHPLTVPQYIREIVEQIAFSARDDKKVDKRSGVSQRLPISCMENVISNAERRAIRNGENTVVPRVSDIYAALPAITGKLELEYEGEMKGGDTVARDLIRTAIAKTYDKYFKEVKTEQIVQWFDLGGNIQITDGAGAAETLTALQGIQGLMDKLGSVLGNPKVNSKSGAEVQVSAAEFLLEGLHAHKRIGRSEERVFKADKQAKRPERATVERESGAEDFPPPRNRRPYN
ncbi:MAG: magnesium chelatase, partial [Terriglobales bacterium]